MNDNILGRTSGTIANYHPYLRDGTSDRNTTKGLFNARLRTFDALPSF